MVITSGRNENIMYLKSLYTKKGRRQEKKFVIEGENTVNEVKNNYKFDLIYVSESYKNNYKGNLLDENKYIVVEDRLFNSVADTVTPQGIIAIIEEKEYNISDIIKNNPFIILGDRIQDPGNLGTLIRSADAFGASGIIMSNDSVEIHSPKVIRATTGSIFHIPVFHSDLIESIKLLKDNNIKIIASHLEGAKNPDEIDLTQGFAFIMGNEAQGVGDKTMEYVDCSVKIPMIGKAESLNVSVAGSILMYEAQRQRKI